MLGLRTRQQNTNENENAGARLKQGVRNNGRVPLGDVRNKIVKRQPSLNTDDKIDIKKPVNRTTSLRLIAKPEPRPPLKSQRSNDGDKAFHDGVLTRNRSRKSGETLLPGIDNLQQQAPVEAVAELVSDDSASLKDEAAYSTCMILDIDREDHENPQLAATYVNDIYKYLTFLEQEQGVIENFLSAGEITSKMRAILVDWLSQVHIRFHLLPETLYMTVMLLDRFLSVQRVSKGELQLVGVTCMFIAAKYEEMYCPEITDFVYITDNTYDKRDILLCEMKILGCLDFKLGRPLPIHFLRRFSKAADVDGETHTMAKYLMEMSLSDYTQCHLLPSLTAAAALWLAITLIDGEQQWSSTVAHYSGYSEAQILPVVKKIALLASRTHAGKIKQQAIRNKYKTTKYMEMSNNVAFDDLSLLERLSKL